jgi:hypothetical protein
LLLLLRARRACPQQRTEAHNKNDRSHVDDRSHVVVSPRIRSEVGRDTRATRARLAELVRFYAKLRIGLSAYDDAKHAKKLGTLNPVKVVQGLGLSPTSAMIVRELLAPSIMALILSFSFFFSSAESVFMSLRNSLVQLTVSPLPPILALLFQVHTDN